MCSIIFNVIKNIDTWRMYPQFLHIWIYHNYLVTSWDDDDDGNDADDGDDSGGYIH